jgi:two-component sensor histidine kinase
LTSLIDDEEVIDHISTAIKFCNSVDSSKKIDIIMGEEESLKAVNLLFQKIHYFEQNCIIMYAYDITAQYKKEYEIRKNLHEKQTLLEEIHHRVKNNLQIISSLLNFQMKDIETERDRALFLDSQNRIKSIALIHESLYSSGNLSQIDFRQYTEKLVNRLFTIFKVDGNRIKYTIDVKNFEITIKKAIPCGLILDELITNSLKYAFPNERKGAITISLKRRDHHFCICVKDNGIGFDMHALQKMNKIRGLDLISILTKQLNGECRFTNQKGFGCEIQFTE